MLNVILLYDTNWVQKKYVQGFSGICSSFVVNLIQSQEFYSRQIKMSSWYYQSKSKHLRILTWTMSWLNLPLCFQAARQNMDQKKTLFEP